MEEDSIPNRINHIIELDENRRNTLDISIRNQEKVKIIFDKSAKLRSFHIADTVLLWDKQRDKPGKDGKIESLWMGPYIICEIVGTNSFYLNDMEGERLNLPVNGFLLKMFFNKTV